MQLKRMANRTLCIFLDSKRNTAGVLKSEKFYLLDMKGNKHVYNIYFENLEVGRSHACFGRR